MTSDDMAGFFTPTTDDLDTLVGEVLDTAGDGTWPLYMIDAIGVPYFGYFDGVGDFEACPWLSAIDRFVAVDEDRRIHWMHPALRARIAVLDEDDFHCEIGRADIIPGLSRRETAEALADHSLGAMLRLARRQRVAGPLYARIRSLGVVASPATADERLRALFAEAGISAALGWSIAQVALQTPRWESSHIPAHRCLVTRAAILSRLTDPAAAPRPDPIAARRCLVALMISSDAPDHAQPDHAQPDQGPPDRAPLDQSLSDDVILVATAIAHGLLPIDITDAEQDPISVIDMTIGRIERGDFDPRFDPRDAAEPNAASAPERTASTSDPDARPSPMEQAVIDCLFHGPEATAHGKSRLIRAANNRLCALGVELRVNLQKCRRAFEETCQTPF